MSNPVINEQADIADVNLGELIQVDHLKILLAETPEEPVILAMLQYIRREAGAASRAEVGEVIDGRQTMAFVQMGRKEALTDLFWEFWQWSQANADASAEDGEE